MSTQSSPPTSPAIQEWEHVGLSLSSVLDKYLLLSRQLVAKALSENAHATDLIARIDCALQSLRTVLSHQLDYVHSTLAETRNPLASAVYRLPQEILAEIFKFALCTRAHIDPDTSHPFKMETALSHMLRDVRCLKFVCRSWKNTVLSPGLFWYFNLIHLTEIPAFRCIRAPKLGLEGFNKDLYLAAVMGDSSPEPLHYFFNSIRFHKVNATSSFNFPIKALIERILESGFPFTLAELSLYESTCHDKMDKEDIDHVLTTTSPYWSSFCELLKSLSVFRVRGAHFDWNHMTFSHTLVEVRLQDVMMGSDTEELAEFLRVLAKAPNLRDLKLISIQSSLDVDSLDIIGPEDKIQFPSLEVLFLENLAYNTLVTVTEYIAPGSHRLILYLTERAINDDGNADPDLDEVGVATLYPQLERLCVHTLVLSREWDDLSPEDLESLLRSLPELKSLKLNGWVLSKDECYAISCSLLGQPGPATGVFPRLECLDLSCVHIMDQEWVKQIVISHSIQKMALGGYIHSGSVDQHQIQPLKWNEPIIDWLRVNVPNFTLLHKEVQPIEYSSFVWQLW
ncbi:hypothetical protein RSOL_461000, partial [Rhizoctonia solani AG-3 Rhs1AP]